MPLFMDGEICGMNVYWLTAGVALAALIFAVGAFTTRWTRMQRLAFGKDRSNPKDSALHGIVYAFTLGMAPWAKESTRMHWVAYVRGILFHVGIFVGLAALLASLWFDQIDPIVRLPFAGILAFGAIMGAAGGLMRVVEHNLHAISTPDDHISVWLVTVFLAAMAAALISPSILPVTWLTAAVMLVYAPIGKIRHCIYFYFGRLFYGLHIGRRGIVRGLEGSHGS